VQKSFRNGKDVADCRLHKKDGQNQHDVKDTSKEVIRATEQEGYGILYKAEI
jgi:hypothetical protein